MRVVVTLMLLGVAAFAASVVYAAIQMAPETPLVAREHPSFACLREWRCVGPLTVHVTSDGAEYSQYSCEYGIIFLRKPDLES